MSKKYPTKKCKNCGKIFTPNKYNWDRQIYCGSKKEKTTCAGQLHNIWTSKRYHELKEIEKKYYKLLSNK